MSIIEVLQQHGKLTLTQLVTHTKSDEKHVRSVLDVLLATPLVNQERRSVRVFPVSLSLLARSTPPPSPRCV